jgi:hypothetical protein
MRTLLSILLLSGVLLTGMSAKAQAPTPGAISGTYVCVHDTLTIGITVANGTVQLRSGRTTVADPSAVDVSSLPNGVDIAAGTVKLTPTGLTFRTAPGGAATGLTYNLALNADGSLTGSLIGHSNGGPVNITDARFYHQQSK